MKIIPAIDLKGSKCVRLYQGNFEKITEYQIAPVAHAKALVQQGADWLHVVDLEGAQLGKLVQSCAIRELAQVPGLALQVGGGIRQREDLLQLFAMKVSRVVIGSLAVHQVQRVKSWIMEFGPENIVLAFDVILDKYGTPLVVTHGWQQKSLISLWDLIDLYQAVSLKYVLCTDVSCDGTLKGPNVLLYKSLVEKFPDICFQASGGVGQLEHLIDLQNHNVYGVVVGKALYENRFTLQTAIQRSKTC